RRGDGTPCRRTRAPPRVRASSGRSADRSSRPPAGGTAAVPDDPRARAVPPRAGTRAPAECCGVHRRWGRSVRGAARGTKYIKRGKVLRTGVPRLRPILSVAPAVALFTVALTTSLRATTRSKWDLPLAHVSMPMTVSFAARPQARDGARAQTSDLPRAQ